MMYSIRTTSLLCENMRTRSEGANCLPETIVPYTNYNHTETIYRLLNIWGYFCQLPL